MTRSVRTGVLLALLALTSCDNRNGDGSRRESTDVGTATGSWQFKTDPFADSRNLAVAGTADLDGDAEANIAIQCDGSERPKVTVGLSKAKLDLNEQQNEHREHADNSCVNLDPDIFSPCPPKVPDRVTYYATRTVGVQTKLDGGESYTYPATSPDTDASFSVITYPIGDLTSGRQLLLGFPANGKKQILRIDLKDSTLVQFFSQCRAAYDTKRAADAKAKADEENRQRADAEREEQARQAEAQAQARSANLKAGYSYAVGGSQTATSSDGPAVDIYAEPSDGARKQTVKLQVGVGVINVLDVKFDGAGIATWYKALVTSPGDFAAVDATGWIKRADLDNGPELRPSEATSNTTMMWSPNDLDALIQIMRKADGMLRNARPGSSVTAQRPDGSKVVFTRSNTAAFAYTTTFFDKAGKTLSGKNMGNHFPDVATGATGYSAEGTASYINSALNDASSD